MFAQRKFATNLKWALKVKRSGADRETRQNKMKEIRMANQDNGSLKLEDADTYKKAKW